MEQTNTQKNISDFYARNIEVTRERGQDMVNHREAHIYGHNVRNGRLMVLLISKDLTDKKLYYYDATSDPKLETNSLLSFNRE